MMNRLSAGIGGKLRYTKPTVTVGEREEPMAMWRDQRQGAGTNEDVR